MKIIVARVLFCVWIFFGVADASFIISEDFIVDMPSHDTIVEAGTLCNFVWENATYSARNVAYVMIELYQGQELIHIVEKNTVNDGKEQSIIPSSVLPGNYTVLISSSDRAYSGMSQVFTIIAPIPIKILSPQRGTVIKKGDTLSIKWEDSFPGQIVYITLFSVSPQGMRKSQVVIADGIENQGEFLYTVPETMPAGSYVIGIRNPAVAQMKYSDIFLIEAE